MQQGNNTGTTAPPKSKTEEAKDSLGDLANHAQDMASTFYRLQVLKLTQKATDVSANIAGGLVAAVMGLFVVLFGGLALGFWLGEVLRSTALGFLLVAVLFAVLAGIFLAIRKKVVFPMWRNKIIRKLYE